MPVSKVALQKSMLLRAAGLLRPYAVRLPASRLGILAHGLVVFTSCSSSPIRHLARSYGFLGRTWDKCTCFVRPNEAEPWSGLLWVVLGTCDFLLRVYGLLGSQRFPTMPWDKRSPATATSDVWSSWWRRFFRRAQHPSHQNGRMDGWSKGGMFLVMNHHFWPDGS